MRLSLALLLPASLLAHGVEEKPDLLLQVLNTPIKVATTYPVSLRETPAVVTLVTRAEIQAMGAADLMDVLRMVPGFEFASDTQGAVGLAVRGNFAHYGKALLLWDGLEMNEPLYGTTTFGGHYPVAAIEQIEIIRGPGSAVYGGYAECAVIKVTTRKGGELDGGAGGLRLAAMAGGAFNRVADLAYGRAWNDTEMSLAYSGGRSFRGTGDWPLGPDATISAAKAGGLDSDFLDLGLRSGPAELRYVRDLHTIQDFTGEFLAGVQPMTFKGDFLSAGYRWQAGEALTLTPRVSVKEQVPWFYPQIGTLDTTRSTFGVDAAWAAAPDLRMVFLAEQSFDHAVQYHRPPGWQGRDHFSYAFRALAWQALWNPGAFSADAGLRVDQHSQFGSTLSPRLAVTRAEPGWHLKAIASGAFCAPAIAELRDNPQLQPERTRTFEVEAGLRLGPAAYLTANLFMVRIDDPIAYVLKDGHDFFANFDHTGSRGIELDLQVRREDLWIHGTCSFAAADDANAPFFQVAGDDSRHVGLAKAKLSVLARWQFAPDWALSPALTALGPRYGYRLGDPQPSRFESAVLADLWLTWTPARAYSVQLGGSNLLDRDNPYIQGYGLPGTGGNPPLPGPGRTLALKVTFTF